MKIMKYAFNTWAYSSFPAWLPAYTLDEAIRRLAGIGYDGVEIGCAAPHAWPAYLNAERRRELRRLLESSALEVVSLLATPGGGTGFNPASPCAQERDATVKYYQEVTDLASELGARKVIYIAGWQIFGTTRQEAWSRSRDCLDCIAAYASHKDITIVVEPTAAATNLIETADDAIELMRSVEHSNVKLMFDTLHALYRNEIPADYARAMGKDLVHIHVSDRNRVLPGEGLLQVLRDCEFDEFITMEIGLDGRSADPDRIARTALAYLKDVETKLNASVGLSEEKRAFRR